VPTSPVGAKARERHRKLIAATGLCMNCGRKITLCGRPFTADIICRKCKCINHFVMSQQPISVGKPAI
jgi:hypothetical protein